MLYRSTVYVVLVDSSRYCSTDDVVTITTTAVVVGTGHLQYYRTYYTYYGTYEYCLRVLPTTYYLLPTTVPTRYLQYHRLIPMCWIADRVSAFRQVLKNTSAQIVQGLSLIL